MKIHKAKFIEKYSERIKDELNLSEKDSLEMGKEMVNIMIDEMSDSMINGAGFRVTGFGTMNIKDVEATKKFNPFKKEHFVMKAHKKPAFKCSNAFREYMCE